MNLDDDPAPPQAAVKSAAAVSAVIIAIFCNVFLIMLLLTFGNNVSCLEYKIANASMQRVRRKIKIIETKINN